MAQVAFGESTSRGGVYALNGVTAAVRSHVYTFTAASTFNGAVPVTATDRATNATTRTFTLVRDATPPQVWLNSPVRVATGVFTVTWGAVDARAV